MYIVDAGGRPDHALDWLSAMPLPHFLEHHRVLRGAFAGIIVLALSVAAMVYIAGDRFRSDVLRAVSSAAPPSLSTGQLNLLALCVALAVAGLVSMVAAALSARVVKSIGYWRQEPDISPASAAWIRGMMDGRDWSSVLPRALAASVLSLASKGAIALLPGNVGRNATAGAAGRKQTAGHPGGYIADAYGNPRASVAFADVPGAQILDAMPGQTFTPVSSQPSTPTGVPGPAVAVTPSPYAPADSDTSPGKTTPDPIHRVADGWLGFDGPEGSVTTIVILPAAHDPHLALYDSEMAALDVLERVTQHKGVTMFDTSQMRETYRNWGDGTQALTGFSDRMRLEFRGLHATHRVGRLALVCGLVLLPVSFVALAVLMAQGLIALLPAVTMVLAVTMLLGTNRYGLTYTGRYYATQVNGLADYLEDFGEFKDRDIPDLKLWNRYLVFAAAFGIANKALWRGRDTIPIVIDEQEFEDQFTFVGMALDAGVDHAINLWNWLFGD
ncbi:DUF2207 family protein [Bifidobacterium thermophilum]|uniref:Predicted membrane protein YciQ-like C-terminal domain-containing protein n=1 Tax=Bifidobacterium thermophilum RBL67 TaxID=1254439 RepID=M4RE43_9BIFI|nr:DUF2207 domain-containing protein [Bifidobacterium thermophilum]AGH41775.1 hypothetical protein D805_1508 [Bifidobacterium thermophilum RBL67]MDW8486288.1 DUF2207 domain-containing protein [Bifidobacterium thermophilum]